MYRFSNINWAAFLWGGVLWPLWNRFYGWAVACYAVGIFVGLTSLRLDAAGIITSIIVQQLTSYAFAVFLALRGNRMLAERIEDAQLSFEEKCSARSWTYKSQKRQAFSGILLMFFSCSALIVITYFFPVGFVSLHHLGIAALVYIVLLVILLVLAALYSPKENELLSDSKGGYKKSEESLLFSQIRTGNLYKLFRSPWFPLVFFTALISIGMVPLLLFHQSESELSSFELVEELEKVQRFKINGTESSNDWMHYQDGQFSAVGFIAGSRVFFPEKVEDITVYHAMRFYTGDDLTHEVLSAPEQDFAIPDEVFSYFGQSEFRGRNVVQHRLAHFLFSLSGDSLYVHQITEFEDYTYGSDEVEALLHNSLHLDRSFKMESPDLSSPFWLNVGNSQAFELSGTSMGGRIDSGIDPAVSDRYGFPRGYVAKVYVRTSSMLGNVPIYHFVTIYFQSLEDATSFGGNSITEPGWDIEVSVTVADGVLASSTE